MVKRTVPSVAAEVAVLCRIMEKNDSIGIIHLNDLSISDTEVRAFDDDGNEEFGQSSTSTMLNSMARVAEV